MSTPGPGPPKSRSSWIPRRLRERDWFWPKAAWLGIRWVGTIFVHPLSAAASWLLGVLTLCGVVIVLHPNALLVFLFLVVALLLIVGRGARLKWEQDRGSVDQRDPAPQIGTYMHQPHFHFGENTDAATELFKRISGVETDLPIPGGQPPVHGPEAQTPEQNDDAEGAE